MSDADAPVPDELAETEDLESAYRRALEAIETAETAVGQALVDLHHPAEDEAADARASNGNQPSNAEDASPPQRSTPSATPPCPRVTPLGILEAALFVGGTDLTTKRLVGLLNGEFDADRIAGFVDELNARYQREGRAYEVALGEGGYRLALRDEFEDVRNRVFGLGPREVKLSQQAIEMLALVAYRQPIDRETIEHHAGKSGMSMVRQLVRRQLVEIDRDDPDEVRYRTTGRFLEVFGIADLTELPRAVELELK